MTMASEQVAAPIAAASAATLWALANDAALAVFALPIGVVLAAAAGAFFAQTFMPAASFWATMRSGLAWTVCGAYSLPLALHLFGAPPKIAGSVAFVFSAGLQLLAPAIVPVLVRNSPAWVRAYIDRLSGRPQTEQKGDENGSADARGSN